MALSLCLHAQRRRRAPWRRRCGSERCIRSVEAVFEEGEYRYPAMTYLNTGDTYNATLVYDVGEDELYVSTWGDWVEDAERQGRQMR